MHRVPQQQPEPQRVPVSSSALVKWFLGSGVFYCELLWSLLSFAVADFLAHSASSVSHQTPVNQVREHQLLVREQATRLTQANLVCSAAWHLAGDSSAHPPPPPHLDVQLKGPHCLLQHAVPLLLRQLHAVHPAAIELLEQVGAGNAREGKERQTIGAFQPHGLLGNSAEHLPSRQVSQVSRVSVSNQELRVFFANLKNTQE